MSSIYCSITVDATQANNTMYATQLTQRYARSIYIGIYSVVTVYATQLLNSLKCFPEPLCIHRVVNLSSTDSVVTVYAAQPLNSLKGFAPPLIEQHRGCQSRACDSVLRHRSKLGIPCLVQEASSEFRAWSTVIAGFLYKQARNSELGPQSLQSETRRNFRYLICGKHVKKTVFTWLFKKRSQTDSAFEEDK